MSCGKLKHLLLILNLPSIGELTLMWNNDKKSTIDYSALPRSKKTRQIVFLDQSHHHSISISSLTYDKSKNLNDFIFKAKAVQTIVHMNV